MKKISYFLSALLVFSLTINAQNYLNESFEEDFPPQNWKVIISGEQSSDEELQVDQWTDNPDDSYWQRSKSGEKSAWILFQYCEDENAKIYLITPQLAVKQDNYKLDFSMYVDNYSPYEGIFKVLVSTSGNNEEDFSQNALLELETAEMFNGFDDYQLNLTDYIGQKVYIAFVFADPNAYTWFFIDDVKGLEIADEESGNQNPCFEITSLPFEENFNNVGIHDLPTCWQKIGYNFFQDMWYPTTLVNGYMNSNWLAFMDMDGGNQMTVSMPKINEELCEINELKVSFLATNYGNGQLVVGVMDNPTDINSFVEIKKISPVGYVWTEYEVDFSEYEGNGRYITFRAGSPYDEETFVGIDEIKLDLSQKIIIDIDTVYQTIDNYFCEGASFDFNGKSLSQEGFYYDTINLSETQVQITELILTKIPGYNQTINATINEGETYNENGFNATVSGTYNLNLTSEKGCDSIITLNLTVIPIVVPCETIYTELKKNICNGEYFEFKNENITQAGVYYDTLQNINGCDSIVILVLNVNNVYSTPINATINEGETYNEYGFNENTAGTYYQYLQTIDGCDSTVVLNLNVNNDLNEISENLNINIFPNPTKNNVTIEYNNGMNEYAIIITDINGRIVYSKTVVDNNKQNIDVSQFSNGIYNICIKDKKRQFYQKLIVE